MPLFATGDGEAWEVAALARLLAGIGQNDGKEASRLPEIEEEIPSEGCLEEADDFEELLPRPELDQLAEAFWKRHKQQYAAAVEPSDSLISRLFKEIAKRATTVRDIWTVRMKQNSN